jgi:hypothetical protein
VLQQPLPHREELRTHLGSVLEAMTRSQSRTLCFFRNFFVRYLRYLYTNRAHDGLPGLGKVAWPIHATYQVLAKRGLQRFLVAWLPQDCHPRQPHSLAAILVIEQNACTMSQAGKQTALPCRMPSNKGCYQP